MGHEQHDYIGIILYSLPFIIFPFFFFFYGAMALLLFFLSRQRSCTEICLLVVTHISCRLLISVSTSILIKFNKDFGLG